MYRLLLCAHRTHCCLYLHEARGISRALMLDWLKSAELNTPPSLQNPSSLKRHVDYTYKSVHFFYNLLLFIYFFGAGCVQNHSLKKCCKGPNRATGLCEQLGGLRPCICSWAFCLPRNKCRELLRTLWLFVFCLFFIFFRVSPCVLWISVGKVGHYVTDPSLINYCCWHQHCWKAT